MPYITQSRRAAIVKRNSGGAAQIGVSHIDNVGELTYAISYLLNHYAYKRSKGGDGLRFTTVAEIAGAAKVAYDEFARNVVAPKEDQSAVENAPAFDSKAKINPYNFIDHDFNDD